VTWTRYNNRTTLASTTLDGLIRMRVFVGVTLNRRRRYS